MLKEITSDVFDISSRLKEIDSCYKLFFNTAKKRFEVHSKFALEVVSPFENLDIRLLDHVKKTRIENRQKLVEQIDKENKANEERLRKKLLEDALCAREEICK